MFTNQMHIFLKSGPSKLILFDILECHFRRSKCLFIISNAKGKNSNTNDQIHEIWRLKCQIIFANFGQFHFFKLG